jgi:hypothetical protein
MRNWPGVWAPRQKEEDEERETVKLHMSGCCAWARAAYTGAYPGAAGSVALPSATCEDTGPRPRSAEPA